jgi:hypothetical protein
LAGGANGIYSLGKECVCLKLEYRLVSGEGDERSLYMYDYIHVEEIAARQWCDYLVKDAAVYTKEKSVVDGDHTVIYVSVADDEYALPIDRIGSSSLGLVIELREFSEEATEYPVIDTIRVYNHLEALLRLQSDILVHQGTRWLKSSCEIDEDRKMYVYYATRG